MSKIFSGQTKLTIEIQLGTSITDATSAVFEYENPHSQKGEWAATIFNATTGILRLEISSVDQTKPAGKWKIWPKITYIDGKIIYGTVNQIEFLKPGTC